MAAVGNALRGAAQGARSGARTGARLNTMSIDLVTGNALYRHSSHADDAAALLEKELLAQAKSRAPGPGR